MPEPRYSRKRGYSDSVRNRACRVLKYRAAVASLTHFLVIIKLQYESTQCPLSLEAVAKPGVSCCQGTVLTVPNRCRQDNGFSR